MKHRLTNADSAWQAAVVLGAPYSYLDISGKSRSAWSPGIDLALSKTLTPRYTAISELRYVYTAIPTAIGGEGNNYLHAGGIDLGMRIGSLVTLLEAAGCPGHESATSALGRKS